MFKRSRATPAWPPSPMGRRVGDEGKFLAFSVGWRPLTPAPLPIGRGVLARRPQAALQRLSRCPLAERAPDSAQGSATDVATKKSSKSILFFKICGTLIFSCLTNEDCASVRLDRRCRRSPVRKVQPRLGEKIWRNPKSPASKFSASKPLKFPKTAKGKFGKACKKPPKICKKFGKSLEKICRPRRRSRRGAKLGF